MCGLCLCLLVAYSHAQADTLDMGAYEEALADMELELSTLSDNYYVIIPSGVAGNMIVFTGSEHTILVDDMYSVLIPKIKELLAELKASGYQGILALEPHLAFAGHSTGFSGESGMIYAVEALRKLMAEVGCVEAA